MLDDRVKDGSRRERRKEGDRRVEVNRNEKRMDKKEE